MTGFCRFFSLYIRTDWKGNTTQFVFSTLGISLGIAIFLAIEILGVHNNLYIEDSSRIVNGGDLSIVPDQNTVTASQSQFLGELRDSGDIIFTEATFGKTVVNYGSRSSLVVLRFVDSNDYPLYQDAKEQVDFAQVLTDTEVIISKNLGDRLGAEVGDEIAIFNSEQQTMVSFTVGEIVLSDGETALDMNIWGCVFLNKDLIDDFIDVEGETSKIYLKITDRSRIEYITAETRRMFPDGRIITLRDVMQSVQQQIDTLNLALSIIGILTFIIAGIGIAGTMLLSVQEKKRDLSILKTLGLKNRQLTFILAGESVLTCLVANLLGIPMGILLSNGVSYLVYGKMIHFSGVSTFVPSIFLVIIFSVFIGVVFTLVPIIATRDIKPLEILREQKVQKRNRRQLILPVIVMALGIGLLYSLFVQSIIGLWITTGILVLGAVLYLVLILLLKLISRLPSFSLTSLVFALRNIKTRLGITPVVFVTFIFGILSIGITLNVNFSVLPALTQTIGEQAGYNLIVFSFSDDVTAVRDVLEETDGIIDFSETKTVKAGFLSVNGIDSQDRFIEQSETYPQIANFAVEGIEPGGEVPRMIMKEGRALSESDSGADTAIITYQLAAGMGIGIDDEIGVSIDDESVNLRVVGIKESSLVNNSVVMISMETFNRYAPAERRSYYVYAEEDEIDVVYANLTASVDNILVLKIEELMSALTATIADILLLFEFVSILCIVTSILQIGNLTLISAMERIREFLLLKTMGAKNGDIQKIILVENSLIAVCSGLLAIGLTEVITFIGFTVFEMPHSVNYAVLGGLLVFSVVIVSIPPLLVPLRLQLTRYTSLLRAEQ